MDIEALTSHGQMQRELVQERCNVSSTRPKRKFSLLRLQFRTVARPRGEWLARPGAERLARLRGWWHDVDQPPLLTQLSNSAAKTSCAPDFAGLARGP
jgi:hypothetical protein